MNILKGTETWRELIILFLCCQLFLSLFHQSPTWAAVAARDVVKKGTKEIGAMVGYWKANSLFAEPESTERSAIFFLPRLGMVLTDELKASWLSGNAEVFLEPLAAHFFDPFSASAFGGTLNLKYNFLSFGRWIPYWDAGAGILWTDLAPRISEQSTQWNFILQTGPGLHFLVNDTLALNLGVRFNHISNANGGERNTGLNAWMFNIGFSFFLP